MNFLRSSIGIVAFLVSSSLLAVAEEHAPHTPNPFRVATVQMEVTGSIDANLARILRGIDEGAAAGARVVVFPETALSGFERAEVEKLDWEKLEGAMGEVAERAKARGVYVLYGTATRAGAEKDKDKEKEKEKGGGKAKEGEKGADGVKGKDGEKGNKKERRLFNSAVLIGPDGIEITRYHKMHPEGWFEPGDHLALFEIDGVPCTVMVCHDERFPEIARLPVLSGALAVFYISYEINSLEGAARKAEGYRAQLIARAAENGVWVVQANGIGPLGEGVERHSLGQSRIVDPGGQVVAEAPALKDFMLVQEIDPARSKRGNALETLDGSALADWWREGMKFVRRAKPAGAN